MRGAGRHRLLIAALCVAAVTAGCASRKNTAANRNYQAFITRYNIYYNGDTHYRETLAEMEANYEDDFTRLLPMHPAQARGIAGAPQPSGSFTRSIEKAQKAIQLRSIRKRPRRTPGRSRDPEYKEWLKREEYNPFIHNAWMLLGKSQYMDGDFLGAAATFMYVARHFGWLPETVAQATLWQSISYTAAGWVHEAEAILGRVKKKELSSGELEGLYGFARADVAIATGRYAEAVEPLRLAISHSHGVQRVRLTFLLGQLLERTGDTTGAHTAYSKAGSSFSAPYRTKFNARIRRGATAPPAQASKELKALRRMTRYSRNSPYLDQIYHAEGNLHLAMGDTAAAEKAYATAVSKSERRGIDMAIASLALGQLLFSRGEYDKAQPRYAEALPLLPDDYPGYAAIRLRSDVLDELAVHSRNIHLQDSLLVLSGMSAKEQLSVVNRIIEALVRREKEEEQLREREEIEASASEREREAADASGNALAPAAFTMNSDKSWYFYNDAVKNAGAAEFRKRWGGRKLEDNWRRRNKNEYAALSEEEPESPADQPDSLSAENTPEEKPANDPHSPEFYLRNIPSTPAERQAAEAIIVEALYNSGLILKDKLEDFEGAARQWEKLLGRFPDNEYRLDTYYNLYLMRMRQGRRNEAEKWRKLIITEFADSPLGQAMVDPDYLDRLREMPRRQEELYEKVFGDFMANRNSLVQSAADSAITTYPLSPLVPKFMFLKALSYVSDGNVPAFRAQLKELLEKYPEADAAPLASSYLRGLSAGKEVMSGDDNSRSIRAARFIATSEESLPPVPDDSLIVDLDPDSPHVVLLAYDVDSISANEVLYEVARYNFSTFTIRDFDLEQLRFGHLGVLVVGGLADLDEASRYLAMLKAPEGAALPPGVTALLVSEENLKMMLTRGLTIDDYLRAAENATMQRVGSLQYSEESDETLQDTMD